MVMAIHLFLLWLLLARLSRSSSFSSESSPHGLQTRQETLPLQDIVTWDEYSISVYGERIIILSGEFHPFRLPSPGLWSDVFQKIRALGYSGVSFYLDWAVLEGEPGRIRMNGVFALDKFFNAASEAGLYLIARPGPYINAETSGGGFPGWLGRLNGTLKSIDGDYLDTITPYMATVGGIIAEAQITNGGPVILFQPENEYTLCLSTAGYTQMNNLTVTQLDSSCLEKEYMAYVQSQYRKAGIAVPFIINDAYPLGNFAPGSGLGAADIYSFDNYPLYWTTAATDPNNWDTLANAPLLYNYTTHEQMSPKTPFSISELQGGAPDPWGGVGVESAAAYIGHEFERVIYKANYGMRIAIQNLYMIFGGTNWGNLGYPGGYTSYDVGAAITENREVNREKYSELKLQANFLQVSPGYLTSQPDDGSVGIYTDTHELVVTALKGSPTAFYVVRHADMSSLNSTPYKVTFNTSLGFLTIPQLGGSLSLNGRDSKFHVVDYDVGGINLIYSTAEIFSWKKSGSKSILVLYGGENELHELALPAGLGAPSNIEGKGVNAQTSNSSILVQWKVDQSRRVVSFGERLEILLLWRNEAYNYWVLDLPAPKPLGLHISPSRADKSVIVKAGYLLRSAKILGEALYLTGDVNRTTELELISAPTNISSLFFNGKEVKTQLRHHRLIGTILFRTPDIVLPHLARLDWRYFDSLPELNGEYNDADWNSCNHKDSNNLRTLSTPTSLYASDYGYHAGSLVYRGHFLANGNESSLYLLTEGGFAYGHSVWLNSTYLGSWPGSPATMFYNQTLDIPTALQPGLPYVVTIIIDHMGIDENFPANVQTMKDPRGVLDYELHGRDKSAISWKLTGNLDGEQYRDISRGPLNEGGMYGERQGYHLPGAPLSQWEQKSPICDGLTTAGVGFFATTFDLHIPAGYDIPISVVFANKSETETPTAKFRAQIYINGWQFGKYVNHIGPQLRFPVPEGILNYNGSNYLVVTMWSHEDRPVKLDGLTLEVDAKVQSGYQKPSLVNGARYLARNGSY